jgi:hypothetical protein
VATPNGPLRQPGPLELQIWAACPGLDEVPAEVLAGGGTAEAEAMRSRVEECRYQCLLCGGLARAALVARPLIDPDARPVFVDLCWACFSALKSELDTW